ncbi:salicylate hydroxylase [Purpureocillium lavendulum]|uniref:Salicylate hydroxylase n=1 Tax=Purpureocillium lavendulum TaxID=1247861 RepID=A0AB34FYU3_9HYPO|nr:salicylate hydroxylase [Purpureocillium lavendulum]
MDVPSLHHPRSYQQQQQQQQQHPHQQQQQHPHQHQHHPGGGGGGAGAGVGAGDGARYDYGGDSGHEGSSLPVGDEPAKKKQKRNKPTLSCHECVERKTKATLTLRHAKGRWGKCQGSHVNGKDRCDWTGIKRQTECRYAHVANLLEETSRSVANGRRMTKPPKKKAVADGKLSIPNIADRGAIIDHEASSRGAVALSLGLLSHVPYSVTGASNVFGIGSEHPFANYWTCEGGLPEVISVLPDKIQADILLARYFECVDPVYPMIHRQTFYADYEHFWQLNAAERNKTDAAFVGLIFVMLALGTQFVTSTAPKERKQTAEFYASASNQALRMSSYLSTASLSSIQAMVLLTYFLINDNHASDGWAFAGILIRQAYAMGLHRDPNIVTPNANPFEKQQRRKVWQAVLLQDTFLTVLLSLPPSATHTDVSVEDLLDDSSSIASSDPMDTAYIRGSWMLANLVQETICSPRSLDLPICATARHKSKLVADFRAVYRSFPDVFRSWDAYSLTRLAATNKRIIRQTLFLTSNYFHNLMLVHASECPDVPVNVRGTLEAAHDAIGAFFLLFSLLESEARVWWVFQHRAFLEALCIGNVLREVSREPGGKDLLQRDPLFVRAKADITRMIQIMQLMDEEGGVSLTRVSLLGEYLDAWVVSEYLERDSSAAGWEKVARTLAIFVYIDDAVPTAFVTLNVPNGGKTTEALTFRLDVDQSGHACDHGNLRINGHQLNQTVNGGGQGVVSRDGDPAIKANWLFSCLEKDNAPYDQVVSVTVDEVDGRPIEPTGFETFFRQRYPVSIIDVDGAAVVNRFHTLTVSQPKTQERPLTQSDGGVDQIDVDAKLTSTTIENEVQTRIQELDLLRIQARRLGDLIYEKEQAIAQLLGKKPPVPSAKVDNCESVRCVLSYLSRKFRDATGHFGADMEELKGFVADADDMPLPTPDDVDADFWREGDLQDDMENENSPDVYEITDHDGTWEWDEEVTLTPEELTELQEADRHTHRFRRRPQLLMAIALTALAVCSLSFCAIHFLHRRSTRTSQGGHRSLEAAESQHGRLRARSERRARRQARKEAVRTFVHGLIPRWKRTDDDQSEKTLAEKDVEVEADTTMEEEIAQFREAAAMVDNIIAAEEGRARQAHERQHANDADSDEVDSPPSYESVSNDSSIVANGFRYAPSHH